MDFFCSIILLVLLFDQVVSRYSTQNWWNHYYGGITIPDDEIEITTEHPSVAISNHYQLFCDVDSNKDAENLRLNEATFGYSVWRSDPWKIGGDPGVTNGRIFEFQCKSEGRPGYFNFVKINPTSSCVKQFMGVTIRTLREYIETRSGSNHLSLSLSLSGEAKNITSSHRASVAFAHTSSSEYSGLHALFAEKQGEIVLLTAQCFSHDVRTSTFFLRPKFDSEFIEALNLIDSDNSEANMKIFIERFGTHYFRKADFGAALVYERRYTSASQTYHDVERRHNCSKIEASGCYRGQERSIFGFSSKSSSICAAGSVDQCSSEGFDSSFGVGYGVSSTRIITIGSEPTIFEDWGNEDDFQPVPLRRELGLISELLTAKNLAQSEEYGFPKSLDADSIRGLFNQVAEKYCHLILGLPLAECTQDLSGCGLSDSCSLDEICVNDPNEAKGYRCIDQ